MKTIIALLLFVSVACLGQTTIKVPAGTDSVLNVKQKAILTGMSLNQYGTLNHVTYIIRKVTLDGNTELNVTGSETKRKLYEDKEYNYQIGGVWIDPSTETILPDTTGITPKQLLSEYLRLKAINTYPGVANGDPLWELVDGILRKIIQIRQNSKQLPE